MTTPDITPADRAAAAAFTLASGEFVDEDLLAEHFAAWRVKERERCVAVLRKQGDSHERQAMGYLGAGNYEEEDRHFKKMCAFDDAAEYLQRELAELKGGAK